MQRRLIGIVVALLVIALVASPTLAKRHYVEGEVIKVQLQQETQTRNRGELNELTIRTREGQELRLLLGEGPCAHCPREGHRVRVRLMREVGPPDEPCEVRGLRNLTTRERFRVRDRSGDLVRTREHTRLGRHTGAGRTKGAGKGHRGGRG